jgi:hypothetical protein
MLVWIEVLASLGAVTAGYLLCRAVRSRPILSLTSTQLGGAVLRMVNPTNDKILIREVIFQPEVYALALRGHAYLVGRIA